MPIYVTRSSMPELSEYIEEIKPLFETHMLTNMGPIYKKFQGELISYLGVRDLSLFVNGHLALEIAIQALGMTKRRGSRRRRSDHDTVHVCFHDTCDHEE